MWSYVRGLSVKICLANKEKMRTFHCYLNNSLQYGRLNPIECNTVYCIVIWGSAVYTQQTSIKHRPEPLHLSTVFSYTKLFFSK